LERQLTAFGFDMWIATDSSASIPQRLGQVLNNLEPVDRTRFPHSFIHFMETNQADMFDQFVNLFNLSGTGLNPKSQSYLKVFLEGDRNR
jgi:DEAD/DEAH box helicase domain-containing protein